MKIDNIDSYLREKDVKPSYQRTKIFQYILDNHNHPTVNQIYEALTDKIPTLSKTTVYNTLNLFIEKKLVEIITIEGNEARYDIYNPNDHAHFKCQLCKNLFDIHLDFSKMSLKELEDYKINEQHIHFIGICPECAKKQI
ncbi:Fur family transcriptional regulator [Clostridium polynesiense]|uniref:Fur family transcriptional regulator n=1 Tax=Clostridium polynesiense TaxID=1325933 RepID=UPI00058DA9EE|nr:Fur family transcriptional regulator [Clostridium polynesiense]